MIDVAGGAFCAFTKCVLLLRRLQLRLGHQVEMAQRGYTHGHLPATGQCQLSAAVALY